MAWGAEKAPSGKKHAAGKRVPARGNVRKQAASPFLGSPCLERLASRVVSLVNSNHDLFLTQSCLGTKRWWKQAWWCTGCGCGCWMLQMWMLQMWMLQMWMQMWMLQMWMLHMAYTRGGRNCEAGVGGHKRVIKFSRRHCKARRP